ncbi:MAG: siderophore-interacting protein [Pseudomonadota bacterium]
MPEHSAHLNADPEKVIAPLAALAEQNGFEVLRENGTCTIDAPLGYVKIIQETGGAGIVFGADTPAKLQSLKDLYAQRIANIGMLDAIDWETPDARIPLNQRITRVVSKEQISENFMRVRLKGDFTAFTEEGAGLHFRLLFNQSGSERPSLDNRGITYWPGGPTNWHKPVYTVRAIGPEADWIDMDVVLHEGGRVTKWCGDVAAGTEIVVMGPNGGGIPIASWYGLIGDETALPVMMRIIEAAPAEASGQAFIFVRDWDDAQEIQTHSQIQVSWAQMYKDDPVEAAYMLQPKGDDYHVFFAAERRQASAAREVFRERDFAPRLCKSASYWTTK